MEVKNWVFTPAFCSARMMLDFLDYLHPLVPASQYTHVIVDDNYPINKEKNSENIRGLSREYNCIYLNSGKNLGLHHCLNWAMKEVGVKETDFYINCDADDRPQEGTFNAMRHVMNADPTLAVLGCSFKKIQNKLDCLKTETIAGHEVFIHPTVEMWNVSAINLKFLASIGGFNEPYDFYGGLESYFYSKYRYTDMRIGYLKHYTSDVPSFDLSLMDPRFIEYKNAHVSLTNPFKGSFEDYLKG